MTWLTIKNLVELLKHITLAILQGRSQEECFAARALRGSQECRKQVIITLLKTIKGTLSAQSFLIIPFLLIYPLFKSARTSCTTPDPTVRNKNLDPL